MERVEEAEDVVEKKEALEETVGRVATKEGAAVGSEGRRAVACGGEETGGRLLRLAVGGWVRGSVVAMWVALR